MRCITFFSHLAFLKMATLTVIMKFYRIWYVLQISAKVVLVHSLDLLDSVCLKDSSYFPQFIYNWFFLIKQFVLTKFLSHDTFIIIISCILFEKDVLRTEIIYIIFPKSIYRKTYVLCENLWLNNAGVIVFQVYPWFLGFSIHLSRFMISLRLLENLDI